nr:hypothetical protein [Mesorhizobium silamurunense]
MTCGEGGAPRRSSQSSEVEAGRKVLGDQFAIEAEAPRRFPAARRAVAALAVAEAAHQFAQHRQHRRFLFQRLSCQAMRPHEGPRQIGREHNAFAEHRQSRQFQILGDLGHQHGIGIAGAVGPAGGNAFLTVMRLFRIDDDDRARRRQMLAAADAQLLDAGHHDAEHPGWMGVQRIGMVAIAGGEHFETAQAFMLRQPCRFAFRLLAGVAHEGSLSRNRPARQSRSRRQPTTQARSAHSNTETDNAEERQDSGHRARGDRLAASDPRQSGTRLRRA